jgi:zinc resistance-associated protein
MHLADVFGFLGGYFMWKKTFVCAAALIIAGSMIVYAQQGPGEPNASGEDKGASTNSNADISALHWVPKFNMEDMAAFADARIAALHAGLNLNADQEKIWAPFEQSLRDLIKMRTDGFAATREQQPSSDPIMRLQRLADALSTRGAILKRLADTLAPLYQSFDDGQKRRFTILARFMRRHTQDFGMWHGDTARHGRMRGGDNFHGGPYRFGDGEATPD